MDHTRQGSYTVAIGLMVVGSFAFAIAAAMNANFSASMAVDAEQQLSRGASLVIDSAAVMLVIAAGLLLRARRWLAAILPVMGLLWLTMIGLANTVGYTAANRFAVAAARVFNARALDDAEARAERERRRFVAELMAEARAAKKGERYTYIGEAAKAALNAPVLAKRSASEVVPDAGAAALSRILGFPSEIVALALTVALPIGLILAKLICFGLGSFLWPQRERGRAGEARRGVAQPALPAQLGLANDPAIGLASPPPGREAERALGRAHWQAEHAPRQDADNDDDRQPPPVSDAASALMGPTDAKVVLASPAALHALASNDCVAAWLSTRPPAAQPEHCKALHSAYAEWCRRQGVQPMAEHLFLQRLRALGCDRIREVTPGGSGRAFYLLPQHTIPGLGRYAGAAA